MKSTKCITFDKDAQDALPEHIKANMKADRNKAQAQKKEVCGLCSLFEDEDVNGEGWCAFHQRPTKCDCRCNDFIRSNNS